VKLEAARRRRRAAIAHGPVAARCVEDHGRASGVFDAAVYPSLIVARRLANDSRASSMQRALVETSVHETASCGVAWRVPAEQLPFDTSRGAPWILLPPEARRGFDRLRDLGRPLAESELGVLASA
jgi:hypothetical protein